MDKTELDRRAKAKGQASSKPKGAFKDPRGDKKYDPYLLGDPAELEKGEGPPGEWDLAAHEINPDLINRVMAEDIGYDDYEMTEAELGQLGYEELREMAAEYREADKAKLKPAGEN